MRSDGRRLSSHDDAELPGGCVRSSLFGGHDPADRAAKRSAHQRTDNLHWTQNGKIFVQEDGGGYETWQINEDGGGHVRIAQSITEPSGIIDASSELGFLPGSVLLSSVQGTSGTSGAQLVVLVSPTAQIVGPGDYNANGTVDAADYTVWRNSLGQSGAGLPADGDGDQQIDDEDFGIWKANFGESAGASAAVIAAGRAAVPVPSTWGLLIPLILTLGVGFIRPRVRRNPSVRLW